MSDQFVNRLETTQNSARRRTAGDVVKEMMAKSGLEFDEGRLQAKMSGPFADTERVAQLTMEVRFRDGSRMGLPWIDLRFYQVNFNPDGEAYIEMVYPGWNVLVFGRGLLNLVPFLRDHATDLVESVDEDVESDPMYIERVMVEAGDGSSLFEDEPGDVTALVEWGQNYTGRRLKEGVLTGRTTSDFLQREIVGEDADLSLADFGGPDEDEEEERRLNGGRTELQEDGRQSHQHKNRTRELRAAKKEGRKIDKSKLSH